MEFDITIDQGADYRLEFELRDANGAIQSLDGHTGRAQIRTRIGGALIADFEVFIGSTITLVLNHMVTAMIAPGNYIYDFILADSSGRRSRRVSGIVKVHGSVTIWN